MNNSLQIKHDVVLAPYTTLGIGGPARYFLRAETEQRVIDALEYVESNGLNLFILGGGSNVLVADDGFDGLVLQIAIRGIADPFKKNLDHASPSLSKRSRVITVGAGEDWDGFVGYCVKKGVAGVECLSGIPGFVGGTPVQNVGAYGQEVSETIVAVRCLDRTKHEIATLSNVECGFTYRQSIFNSSHRDRYIVLSVTFELQEHGKPKIIYKDLIEYFGDKVPSLTDARNAVLKIRQSKSMVIEENDPNSKSAGSFFKNPIISRLELDVIQKSFERVPFFEFGDEVKIPAAWLIEKAGFEKAYTLGRTGISSNHTLAIINRGGATAAEIIALKDEIQKAVRNHFGIDLLPEPMFIGFSDIKN